MYATYLTLIATVLGTMTVGETVTRWSDLNCTGSIKLDYSDCSAALQSAIPGNGAITTRESLDATFGNCKVQIDGTRGRGIAKQVLSYTGQWAMGSGKCHDPFDNTIVPGAFLMPNLQASGKL